MNSKGKVHFVGIGGVGMSGIAHVLLELGYTVLGSDLQVTEVTKQLEKFGATVYAGHHEHNLQSDVETVVISSAIPANNPEVVKAKELGIPIISRGEMLSRLMKRQRGIAVAGAHGKTTTSSMIALVFEKSGYDPTIVLGGRLNNLGGNAKLGRGELIIAEADESDGSFLKLTPEITVVTNVEDDHLDYYGTKEKIKEAFTEYILKTPSKGFTVLCIDDPGVAQLLPKIEGKVRMITYGFSDGADYVAGNLRYEGFRTYFSVTGKGKLLGEMSLSVPGKHNIRNALAAVAVGRESAGLSFKEIARSIKNFQGVHRRFEKLGEIGGVYIYDDYAHHPSELKATLAAARSIKPKRVVAVFQPHRYSRTQLLKEEFGTAFQDADVLLMTDIYPAGEQPIVGICTNTIMEEVQKQTGQKVEYVADKNLLAAKLVEIVSKGDLVLTLGAGNIWSVGKELCELLMKTGKVVS